MNYLVFKASDAFIRGKAGIAQFDTKSDPGTDAVGKASSLLKTFYGYAKTIALPLAILAIGICAMKLILADNPSETSKAKTWLITIIVALCLLFLADPIVTTISNLFSAA